MQRVFDKVKLTIGFQNCVVVNPIGCHGVLAMFWKYNNQVELMNYSQSHIHIQISVGGESRPVWLTGF